MSEYYSSCPGKPCAVCGDTSGKCSVSEYGYALLCYGMPQAQEGELKRTWKCFRKTGEYSQWEDQRIALEKHCNEPQIKVSFFYGNGQPTGLSGIIKEAIRRGKEKEGGKS